MKNIAVIPARSGSKGLKDKNIKLLNNKPLLAYSVEAALKSNIFDEVMVSTDSTEYAEIAAKYGASVPFLRDPKTSSDTSSSWDTVRETLNKYKTLNKYFYNIMLLQPTSPLRNSEDIINAYNLMKLKKSQAVISVTACDYSPLLCNQLNDDLCMNGFINSDNIHRRQDLKQFFRINGAIYLINTDRLFEQNDNFYDKNCFAYIMDKERSIDIDDSTDFLIAEFFLDKGISSL